MNSELVQIFSQLCDHISDEYSLSGARKHQFRLMQIRKAKNTIKSLDFEITTLKQTSSLPGFGKGIQSRISEFLRTGKLKELEIPENEDANTIRALCSVHGIGLARARDLLRQGVRSVLELQSRSQTGQITLSNPIKIGLKYYDSISKRIPSEKIRRIEKYLHDQLPDSTFEICGSYRRGCKTSGDIDILFRQDMTLRAVVKKLTASGFLVAHLTRDSDKKYMGICQFEDDFHRIDFLALKPEEWGTALLHFTGSRDFNRFIRAAAIRKGYKLTQYHLLDRETAKVHNFMTERDVFKYLEIEYLAPSERCL